METIKFTFSKRQRAAVFMFQLDHQRIVEIEAGTVTEAIIKLSAEHSYEAFSYVGRRNKAAR
jgi:hypothetical protein